MNPLFFAAGEDFMEIVFERTKANDTIKKLFIERWNTIKLLSEKIFEFVKLQVNLMANKQPDKDQEAWKSFILENLSLMNDEFFTLSKKVFLHFIEQSMTDDEIKNHFLATWDKTAESIKKIKNIPTSN